MWDRRRQAEEATEGGTPGRLLSASRASASSKKLSSASK